MINRLLNIASDQTVRAKKSEWTIQVHRLKKRTKPIKTGKCLKLEWSYFCWMLGKLYQSANFTSDNLSYIWIFTRCINDKTALIVFGSSYLKNWFHIFCEHFGLLWVVVSAEEKINKNNDTRSIWSNHLCGDTWLNPCEFLVALGIPQLVQGHVKYLMERR